MTGENMAHLRRNWCGRKQGDAVNRREKGRGRTRCLLIAPVRDFGFFPISSEKPLKDFKPRDAMIIFAYLHF